MLGTDVFYDVVEDTAYQFGRAPFPSFAPLQCVSLFPDEQLAAISTADGTVSIQNLNDKEQISNLELFLKVSQIPASSTSKFHRIKRKFSNIAALKNQQLVFCHHLSNQLLITSNLSNSHKQESYLNDMDPVYLLGVHGSPISTIAVDEISSLLISGDSSGSVRVWPLSRDALRNDNSRWKPQPTPSPLFQAHDSVVKSLVYVNQSVTKIQKFVSVGGDLGLIKVWNLLRDTQTVKASLFHSLECGPVDLINLSAHGSMSAVGTACHKLFLWDHDKLQLIMVAEEAEPVDSLSVYTAKQSLCVCGSEKGFVKVFRPTPNGGWQVMAQCFLGGRLLLNQVCNQHLVLLAGNTFNDMVLKHWQLSELPSSSVVSQASVQPEPRPCAPQPTPKYPPQQRLVVEPVIEEVGYAEECQEETGACGSDNDFIPEDRDDTATEGTEEPVPMHFSSLGTATLNSTIASRRKHAAAKDEKFRSGGGGVSDQGLKIAARLPNVPLEDKSRYKELENLDPVPPVAARNVIKKQVDAKWAAQVRSCGLEEDDFYLPHWEPLNTIGRWPMTESGKELLGKLRDETAHLETDLIWAKEISMKLGIGATCYN